TLARSVGPARRVRVVHNGVPPGGDVPPDAEVAALAGDGPLVGAVSHLQPRKGLDVLLGALPGVLARHPAARLAVVRGGAAPQRRSTSCSPIATRVRGTGRARRRGCESRSRSTRCSRG